MDAESISPLQHQMGVLCSIIEIENFSKMTAFQFENKITQIDYFSPISVQKRRTPIGNYE
jgi:hypothetical protein